MLYRVGETRGGAATYTPRMVFFERRGAMGGASAAGYLYGDESGTDGGPLPPILTWDGSAKVVEQPKEGKSRFVRQLEAYEEEEEEEEEEEDDDDDDERRDAPRSADDFSPSDDSDAPDDFFSDASSDPMEALRKRMESHVLRADADERARSSRELGVESLVKKKKRVRTAEERRAARDARARREEEANAVLIETSTTLETESRSWTDFAKAPFHSRSAFLLDGVWSGVDAFGGFGEGVAWADARDRREDLRDVARRWAEECDRMQGFQVFAEDLGGFGGLAYATLEELKDEYPRQPAWLFSLRPAKDFKEQEGRRASSSAAADAEAARYSLLNDALATATLAPLCDAYVPLSADQAAGSRAPDALPPGFSAAEGRNLFRASALAAAFADVAGTSWRAHGPTCCPGARDMRDVARHLSARAGGPFVSASFVIDPDPGGDSKERRGEPSAGDEREKNAAANAEAARRAAAGAPLRRFAGLTPGLRGDRTNLRRRAHDEDSDGEEEDEPLAEAYATRGARWSSSSSSSSSSSGSLKKIFASAAASLASLDAALSLERYRAPRLRLVSEAPLPVPLTFPRAFSLEKKRGEKGEKGSPRFVAATARLASSPAFARVLSAARDGWTRAARGAAGRAALRAWGVDDDEVEEVAERVLELRRGYADDDADDADDDDDEELERI